MPPHPILILGGSQEASGLARVLADDDRFAPVLSLAGVTSMPAPSPIPRRTGRFGGVAGLSSYLLENGVRTLVDATHPFAARITRNAVAATAAVPAAMLRICRPPWAVQRDWILAASADAAAQALAERPATVLLTLGRGDLAPFAARLRRGIHAVWVRSIDPPDPGTLPPGARVLLARPPFDLQGELSTMQELGITHLVARNSGGNAVHAKLDAARLLGVRVVMIARPEEPPGMHRVETVHQAMVWLEARLGA